MNEGDHDNHEHSLKSPMRTLALTDGVFAIIMTLLVLELKVPNLSDASMMHQQLVDCAYKMLIYAASFLLAGVYWTGHRLMFSLVKQVSTTLVWKNIIFLMIASLIPFGAALLGSYPHSHVALTAYGMLLTMLAGWRLWMYIYITSHHHLLFASVHPLRRTRVIRAMTFAPIMFFLSLCIVPYFPTVALVMYCITPVMFVTLITVLNKMAVS